MSLYKDHIFTYGKQINPLMRYPIYQILDNSIPSHKGFIISIKIDSLDKNLRQKAMLAIIDSGELSCINSKWEGNKIIGKANQFGDFTIIIDTIKPIIKSDNIIKNNTIQFKISDELSGIKKYRGEINGEWILMEYDFKTNILKHTFTEEKENTNQELTLSVSDKVGNTKQISIEFFR